MKHEHNPQAIQLIYLLVALAVTNLGLAQTPTFTKVTTGAIVNDFGQFIGCAWGDFNNHGYLDLFVANHDGRTNLFLANNGDGTFTSILSGDPVQDPDYHVGAAIGDYDNDGNLDLLVSAGAAAPNARHLMLYRNNGDHTFSRVSAIAGLNQTGFFGPCAWADFDNDGLLDVIIANHGDANEDGGKNLLFKNNGNGTFTQVLTGSVVNDLSLAFDVRWADYDNDGFEDLLVINSTSDAVNFLYHNNGNGTFARVLTNVIATDGWSSGAAGAAWGDYDNDGMQDLFVTGADGTENRLYHNNGDGTFQIVSSTPMESRLPGTDSFACAWGDYDNDGYLDLFVTSHNGNNRLFHNNGDGTFEEVTDGDPVNDGGPGLYSFSCAWVDYDNDGALDLFATSAGLSAMPNLLYHNSGNTNSWLEVRLVGRLSNRSGIGAKIRAHATIGGKSIWQLREMNSGGGRWSQPLVAHFGLGGATNVDSLQIRWPSGIVQTLTNVAPRQILTVTEHEAGVTQAPTLSGASRAANGSVNLTASGQTGLLYLFEASTNLVNWAWLGVRTNATGSVQFTDAASGNYPARFYRVSIP